jgi:hypothetical protein
VNILSCDEESVSSDEKENAAWHMGKSQVMSNHVLHLLASLA